MPLNTEKLATAKSLQSHGDIQDALDIYLELLNDDPGNQEVLFRAGTASYQLADYKQAARYLADADKAGSRYSVLHNLALCHEKLDDWVSFERYIVKAILHPDATPESFVALVKSIVEHEVAGVSEDVISYVIDRWGNISQVQLLLADYYKLHQNYDEAVRHLCSYLELGDEDVDALYNLAMIARQMRDFEGSIGYFAQYENAVGDCQGLLQIGQTHLLRRNFTEGWRLYGYRHGCEYALPTLQELKTCQALCVRSEHGVGDEIFHAMMLYRAGKDFDTITYECDPRIRPLLSRELPQVNFVDKGSLDCRSQIYAGDLAALYIHSEADLYHPFPEPPAKPLSSVVDAIFAGIPDTSRIGISRYSNSPQASYRMPDEQFWERLFADAQFTVVDLQYGMPGIKTEVPHWLTAANSPLMARADLYNDFELLASLIQRLDCVITIDNYIAHLCGLLQIPCIVLVPYSPDWRWFEDGGLSPWYANMYLARQPGVDDWGGVLEQVRMILSEILDGPGEAKTP